MKITELIKQPEGRRLEFKEKLPSATDIDGTIVAFANDAGGDLLTGIRNEPRKLVGVKEDSLIKLEEQISNINHDHCEPVIFSDSQTRSRIFPFAKIECARFKGITVHVFIDQKTINDNIALQPEAAYDFVLRHINKGSVVQGVYTESRWEYPVVAIREVIRNAVGHRDYSLTGKDIKVAIYDDMVEITSPGKLMPSIDFNDMEAGQSEIRNRVIAPVFKRLGIIDQWGNGLKLIAAELKAYPEIEFRWRETGLQFQIQFVKREIQIHQELQRDLNSVWDQVGTKLGLSRDQVGAKWAPGWHQVEQILDFCIEPKSIKQIMTELGWKNRTKFRNKFINPLLETGIICMTDPKDVNNPKQQYYLSERGKLLLSENP